MVDYEQIGNVVVIALRQDREERAKNPALNTNTDDGASGRNARNMVKFQRLVILIGFLSFCYYRYFTYDQQCLAASSLPTTQNTEDCRSWQYEGNEQQLDLEKLNTEINVIKSELDNKVKEHEQSQIREKEL